jgi:hypothetical protein
MTAKYKKDGQEPTWGKWLWQGVRSASPCKTQAATAVFRGNPSLRSTLRIQASGMA